MTTFKVGDKVRLKADACFKTEKLQRLIDVPMVATKVEEFYGSQLIHADELLGTAAMGSCVAELLELVPPEPALIDATKKYRTRDGQPVEIITTSGPDKCCPVVIHIPGAKKHRRYQVRGADGRCIPSLVENSSDLIEVKPERTRWIVAHEHYGFETKERAQMVAADYPNSAVVRVTFREGEVL
jgi:hypothetical protein